jgi:phenylpyruvate tautomerase PptA (4-oxalocrotonate tautomerase family)
MPHVLVKLDASRTDQQKAKLAEAITKTVMAASCRRSGRKRSTSRIF